jgi:opacity protein-like surface antigen
MAIFGHAWVGAVGRVSIGTLLMVVGAVMGLPIACALPAAADPREDPIFGISELKFGALDHDTPGLWSGFGVERQSVDANIEVLFLPWAYTFGGYLRPAVGATINFNGDTSKAYADLRWETESASGVFLALGMGAAVHNGEINLTDPARKALGSPVLFHPSAEVGYRWDGVNSLSIFADHMSNGFTQRYNEGMDTVGVRYGRRLGPIVSDTPAAEVSIANFSGPYVGAFAGYQYETADWYTVPPVGAALRSFAWGAYAGYNVQSGKGIFGLEVDGSPAKRNVGVGCEVGGISCQMEISGVYSVRARFGWVVSNLMVYGTGGVALAPWQSSVVNLTTSQRFDQAGGLNYGVAVGAGIEYKLLPNLGVRAEVMHYGVAGWDLNLPTAGTTADQFQSYVGRVGITLYLQ